MSDEMARKIHDLRVENKMTLEELGDKVGVGKSTVRKWENGMIANMRRDKIEKVANALGVSPGYLMGWDEEPGNELAYQTYLAEGKRQDAAALDRLLSPDEQEVLFAYRESPGPVKQVIRRALGLKEAESSTGSSKVG